MDSFSFQNPPFIPIVCKKAAEEMQWWIKYYIQEDLRLVRQ